MAKKFFFFTLLGIGLFLAALTPVRAEPLMVSQQEASAQLRFKKTTTLLKENPRSLLLYRFLKSRQSPLAPFAGDLVAAADYYHLDWRLLPAISGLESNFGHLMIPHTYNAYGYLGGYYAFPNWHKSILFMSKYLADVYYARGLTTPEAIGRIYAPPCPYWGNAVRRFMNLLTTE